jgi:hypothetical protein
MNKNHNITAKSHLERQKVKISIGTHRDMKKGRGGKREGSGRKPSGNVALQLRVPPQFIPAILEYVKKLKKRAARIINPPTPLSPAACSTGQS